MTWEEEAQALSQFIANLRITPDEDAELRARISALTGAALRQLTVDALDVFKTTLHDFRRGRSL